MKTILLFVLCAAACLEGQIVGRVLDPSGAAIAGARITIEKQVTSTDDQGAFRLPEIPSGSHIMVVEGAGFEKVQQTIQVSPGEFRLNITLNPAAVKMSVTVIESLGYQVDQVRSATRSSSPLIDIPLSVQPVPRVVIEEQAALSMNDVLRNVTGVSPSLGEGRRDHMLIRGFAAVNDEYIDGVRDDALFFRDLSNIESVEVVKGPGAALFGRGSSGGLINRITKKPEAERALGEIRVIAGSYGVKRTEFDASNPFLDGKLSGRINGAYEDSGTFRDYFNLTRYAFAPSLYWKPNSHTDWLGQFEYLNDQRIPDRGIPALNGAPAPVQIGAYFGYPQDDHIRSRAYSYASTFHRQLNTRWTFRNVAREAEYHTQFSNTFPQGTTLVGAQLFVTRSQYNGSFDQRNIFDQSELSATFQAKGIVNTVLAGIELGRQDRSNSQFNGTAANVPLLNPILTPPNYSPIPGTLNSFTALIGGAYVQDQISWRRWRMLIGVRQDYFDQSQISQLAGVAPLGRIDRAFSPRVGLVYRVSDWASLYASYSKTFDPSGEALSLAANNTDLKPEQTKNLEAGAKANLLKGRLSATAALFRLDRTNIKTTDPANPAYLILVGAQRTDGAEITLTGRITRGLSITGGYAIYDPLILKSNSVTNGVLLQGRIPALVPKRAGNLWATYLWNNGFGVGAGMFQSSRRFAASDNLVTLPGYVRFDATVFYRRRHWEGSLNIRNLLNRSYYETAQSDSQILPGSPVNGLVTAAYRW